MLQFSNHSTKPNHVILVRYCSGNKVRKENNTHKAKPQLGSKGLKNLSKVVSCIQLSKANNAVLL